MAKPIIFTIDDEPQVLNAVERDLRKKFGSDYRIIKAAAGKDALQTLGELHKRKSAVALLLVDQRMPNMSGTEFLAEAIKIYPDAKKVLLTAYADTEAAISSINEVGLDHYLMKPWDPPEENLYPVLEDLLDDWLAAIGLPFDGIQVVGTLWSANSHDAKDFLARNQIPYKWRDIEKDADAKVAVESTNEGKIKLPIVYFPDGSHLISPDNLALAEKIGLQTEASKPFYDVIIVGGGPAGLAAAVYGASEGLQTCLIEKEAPGGQAGTSSRIENYLGFPKGISGADLARRAATQAKRFGVEILTAREAADVRVDGQYKIVTMKDGSELSCHAALITSGVSTRELDKPGVKELTGAGIYYGASLTEAANYHDKEVFVVGGANSAGQGAMFFSRYASNVTMLIRSTGLEKDMSQYLIDQIEGTENIKVMTRTEVSEAIGKERLEKLKIENHDSKEILEVGAAAMFIFIGARPRTETVENVVERDRVGFIFTGQDLYTNGKQPKGWALKRDPYHLETSMPGIFAAGDVRHGSVKRVASAVGEGSVCISLVHQYLKSV